MKKLMILLCVLSLICAVTGCTPTVAPTPSDPSAACQPSVDIIPEEKPLLGDLPEGLFEQEFIFCGGPGGWHTTLTVKPDGSFSGYHRNRNTEVVYACDFTGQFADLEKVNDTTYTLKIQNLTYEKAIDTYWEEDGITYAATTARGLHGADSVTLCLPGTAFESLPDHAQKWYKTAPDPDPLSDGYALCIASADSAFFTYSESEHPAF